MYLDPGFGSMLIQMLIASLAAVAVGFGVFRHKIIAFFSKNKGDVDSAGDSEAGEADGIVEADMNEEVDTVEAGENSDDK